MMKKCPQSAMKLLVPSLINPLGKVYKETGKLPRCFKLQRYFVLMVAEAARVAEIAQTTTLNQADVNELRRPFRSAIRAFLHEADAYGLSHAQTLEFLGATPRKETEGRSS